MTRPVKPTLPITAHHLARNTSRRKLPTSIINATRHQQHHRRRCHHRATRTSTSIIYTQMRRQHQRLLAPKPTRYPITNIGLYILPSSFIIYCATAAMADEFPRAFTNVRYTSFLPPLYGRRVSPRLRVLPPSSSFNRIRLYDGRRVSPRLRPGRYVRFPADTAKVLVTRDPHVPEIGVKIG